LDVSGTLAFIGSFARIYVHYLFAPFPWQAEQARDWYAVGESFLRMGLLVFGVVGVWRARGATRNGLLLLMMVYFSLTCVWAIGTTNFGQSIRHHVTSNWLLVLLGGPPLLMQLATGWRWARDREEPA
ncbi:MAG: hypothetical protein LJE84_07490, partial [Gammaproteobacteria bacterium]|nr:hypothetical protein [Gammaproteobacteria bacterium]